MKKAQDRYRSHGNFLFKNRYLLKGEKEFVPGLFLFLFLSIQNTNMLSFAKHKHAFTVQCISKLLRFVAESYVLYHTQTIIYGRAQGWTTYSGYKVLYNWPNETIGKQRKQCKQCRLSRTNQNGGFKEVQVNWDAEWLKTRFHITLKISQLVLYVEFIIRT